MKEEDTEDEISREIGKGGGEMGWEKNPRGEALQTRQRE